MPQWRRGAVVTCPYPQVRRIIWYSVTVSAAAGYRPPARWTPPGPERRRGPRRTRRTCPARLPGSHPVGQPTPGSHPDGLLPARGRPARARRASRRPSPSPPGRPGSGAGRNPKESRPAYRRNAATSARSGPDQRGLLRQLCASRIGGQILDGQIGGEERRRPPGSLVRNAWISSLRVSPCQVVDGYTVHKSRERLSSL